MTYRFIEPNVKFRQLDEDEQERVVLTLQKLTLDHYVAISAHFYGNCRCGNLQGPSFECPKVKRASYHSVNVSNFIVGRSLLRRR